MPDSTFTPPSAAPPPESLPRATLSPDQVRRMEENRLKAKALRDHHDAAAREAGTALATTPSGFVVGQKRSHASISSSNVPRNNRDASNANDGPSTARILTRPRDDGIRPAKKFDNYIEYDFSKMTDTKGGFLSAADDPHNRAMQHPKEEEKPEHMTQAEWERHQLLKKLKASKSGPFDPSLRVGINNGTKCRECGSLSIDYTWAEVFQCMVCSACKEKYPDKYSLLTKTEAKEDYLLTDYELKNEKILPHLDRPNPHKSTWNNMQLYLRYQVEEYAFSEKRWGSAEALDAEFEKRESDKRKRKEKKFNAKLADLKKRTRIDAYKRSRTAGGSGADVKFGDKVIGFGDRHEHEWGRAVEDPETGMSKKSCIECGMEVEELEF